MYQQFRPNKFASASLCTNKLDKRNLASYKFVKLYGHMHSGSLDKSPPPHLIHVVHMKYIFLHVYLCRAVHFWELLGMMKQNMKKIIIFWYFAVLFASASIKLKKKSFPWRVRFYMLGGMFHIHAGDFTWLAWEIVSRHETHAQCARVDSPDICTHPNSSNWYLGVI